MRLDEVSPKEYLSQAIMLDEKIEANLEALEVLKSRVVSFNAQAFDDVRVDSSTQSDFTNTIDRIVDAEKELNRLIDDYVNLKSRLTIEINELRNNTYSLLLLKRYILNKPLIEVAREMHYTYGTVRHMHGEALKAFRERHLQK